MTSRSAGTLATILAVSTVTLSGCGLDVSPVEEGPAAPTGLAPGTTLYFLGDQGQLVARQRDTGQLGSVPGTVGLLLAGPGGSGLGTGIEETAVTRVGTSVRAEVIELRLPLSSAEVTDAGSDQIVCTAAAAHIQAGGSAEVQVRLRFTDVSENPTYCPAL